MKRRFSNILFAIALLLGATGAASAEPVILVLGDSLSAGHGIDPAVGWVNLLRRQLQDQGYSYRVLNASISGDTTAGGLARLPQALKRQHPSVLIIELGGNDGLRGGSIAVMRDNLRRMIELAHGVGAKVLLLGVRLPPNYGPAYVAAFESVYTHVAKETHTPLVAHFLAGVATHPTLMQADGIHPTAAAQPRLLENVWPALKPLL